MASSSEKGSVVAAAPPPMALVCWWLRKSEEEREAFLSNPSTSINARRNILVVEQYAREHSYFVACGSQMELFPLPSLAPVPRRMKGSWDSFVRLPLAVHPTCGGRRDNALQQHVRRETAQHIIHEVKKRTTLLLMDYLGEEAAWVRHAADTIVEALVEASLAAVYRLGLAETLETAEQETAGGSVRGKKESRSHSSGDLKKRGASRPVGAYRTEAYGALGIWMLLTPQEDATTTTSTGPTNVQCCSSRMKRLRDEANGEVNNWRILREQFTQHQKNDDKAGLSVAPSIRDDTDGLLGQRIIPHSSSTICITEKDIRFGFAKVMRNHTRPAP